jgi:lipopolysaccharide transport system permease protein
MDATISSCPLKHYIEIRPSKKLFDLELDRLWRHRELLYFLIWRELKIRYKQAAIGAGWAVIQPVFTVAIFTAVFGYFAKIPSDGIPYPVFAFTALVPWTYFSEAFRRCATGLVDDSDLIRKIYFPRLIIPLATVTAPMADFLLSFIVLIGLLFWYGITPTWGIVFLPLFLFMAMILALAVGLWLGPLNVRFRDIKHTLPFLIQIWMYASPIVYPLSIVPERWRPLYSLNPMVGVIEGFRWALLGKQSPDVLSIGVSMFAVILLLLGGIVYFKRMERFFADVI